MQTRWAPANHAAWYKYKNMNDPLCPVSRRCAVLCCVVLLQVQVDAAELSGFSVSAPDVIQHYKYKNMKAALANIPAGKDIGGSVSTKVSG